MTNSQQEVNQKCRSGFTIVELMVVVAVIGILAGISLVSYNGAQLRAQNLRRLDNIKTIESSLESYAIHHGGLYPATTANSAANWKTIDVRTDASCFNGSAQTDWVPVITPLPQSFPNVGLAAGVDGNPGCYLYASNGTQYILSAWNMLSAPQTDPATYMRVGFRSFQTSTSTQFYSCNDNVIGGANGSSYDVTKDYYKHSYTVSNIDDCDETPPPGA